MLPYFLLEKDFFILYFSLFILKGDTVLKIFTEVSIFDIIPNLKNIFRVYHEVAFFLKEDYSSLNTKNILLLLILFLYCRYLYFFFNNNKRNNSVFGILYYYPHKESTHSIFLRFSGVILIFLFFFFVFIFSSISFYGDLGILFFFFFSWSFFKYNFCFITFILYFITL